MKLNSYKRLVALAMATTMVFGSSVVALAGEQGAEPQAPATSGNIEGAGTSEGHVDRKATSVTLPTNATADTFAYTMDPERLITETSGGRYTDKLIMPAQDDTGVYFNHGAKGGEGDDKNDLVYQNYSPSLKVINKSSHSVDLTVKAEAVAGADDIPLVEKADIADATEASLYLGLIVGSENAVAVGAETAAEKTVSIAGTAANFKVAAKADKSGYEYRELTLAEYKEKVGDDSKTQDDFDATWANTEFKIEGSVTSGKSITSTTTAPKVKVTWSWVDPDAGPQVTFTNEGVITIANVASGETVTGVTLQFTGGTAENLYNNSNVTWNSDHTSGTLNDAWLTYLEDKGTVTITVTFSDETTETATATY